MSSMQRFIRLSRTWMVAFVLVLFSTAYLSTAYAASNRTTLTWYGQSAFVLTTPKGHTILFDPWFANPMNPQGNKVADALTHVDLILVSHGHFDHVGAAAAISKRTGAKLVGTLDMGEALARYGGFPKENMSYATLGNYGGQLSFFDGEVQILIVPAIHSSHVSGKDLGFNDDDEDHWGGNPAGFVVKIAGGPTIYHTGDTDLFQDMALIPQFSHIDLMLVCIGDHFTMGPARAAAAVALVKPTRAVPMHYGTFLPLMTGTPEAFKEELGKRNLSRTYFPMQVGVPITL
jgi:L-ascorbate metabolism protein UlaG (beta-lactamase superfamily)